MSSQRFATFFLEFLMPAKLDAFPPLRLTASQSRALQIVSTVLHVRPQLFVHIIRYFGAAKNRVEPRPNVSFQVHRSLLFALFPAQGDHWIDLHRPSRRQIRGKGTNH